MKIIIILLPVSIFLLPSCKQKDKLPDSYITRFNDNRRKFEELVKLLERDTSVQHKLIEPLQPSQFIDVVNQRLKDLDIEKVYLLAWRGTHKQLDFITNWRQKTPIHVYYNTLDSIYTNYGYYTKDENSNQIWGLGDKWCLWNEIKLRNITQ